MERIVRPKVRRGAILIYATVAMVLFSGVCLLAVDWGRVQLTKTELQRTADGAARYAVTGVSDGTSLSKANWIGARNTADGTAVTFAAADVEPGTWNSNSNNFSPGGSSPNAVRVMARRTTGSGNPLSLAFGSILGVNTADVTVHAVARLDVVGFGVVGLNYIKMGGNATDSYWSSGGPTLNNSGNIGSNGNITLSGSSSIHGNVYYRPGQAVSGGGSIAGSSNLLSTPLAFPLPTAAVASLLASNNDNGNVPGCPGRVTSTARCWAFRWT
jgi:Flp pilus assembly protein TadG